MHAGITVFRALFIVALLLFLWRMMGQKQLGQLSPIDLITVVIIGTIAGSAIIDLRINIADSVVALAVVVTFNIVFHYAVIKVRKINNKLSYEPVVLVYHGMIVKENLRKAKMPLEALLAILREKGAFDVRCVALALLEPHGKVSVLKEDNKTEGAVCMPLPVVVEGKVQVRQLKKLGYSDEEIKIFSAKYEKELNRIFVAFMDQNYGLHIIRDDVNIEWEMHYE